MMALMAASLVFAAKGSRKSKGKRVSPIQKIEKEAIERNKSDEKLMALVKERSELASKAKTIKNKKEKRKAMGKVGAKTRAIRLHLVKIDEEFKKAYEKMGAGKKNRRKARKSRKK